MVRMYLFPWCQFSYYVHDSGDGCPHRYETQITEAITFNAIEMRK